MTGYLSLFAVAFLAATILPMQSEALLGQVPDVVCACVGGGSNAIGIFSGFIDSDAELIGVEPRGGAAVGRGQQDVARARDPGSFLLYIEQ